MQHGNINAVEVQSGSHCPCLLKQDKTRKIIQWQFWQNCYHKLGRLVYAIPLYLFQTSGPKLHLGNGLWLAKLIEKREKKTIGWNVLAPEGSKFGSVFPPLCSALSSSPPTFCHPTCISLFVSSFLLILHLRSASFLPCSPPAAQSNLSSFAPLWTTSQLGKEDCCPWCIVVTTTLLCWSLTLIP